MALTILPKKGAPVNRRVRAVARHAANGGVACPVAASSTGGPGDGPTLLCLDLGTTTGYAIRFARGATLSGTRSFRTSRFDGGGMRYWCSSDRAGSASIPAPARITPNGHCSSTTRRAALAVHSMRVVHSG